MILILIETRHLASFTMLTVKLYDPTVYVLETKSNIGLSFHLTLVIAYIDSSLTAYLFDFSTLTSFNSALITFLQLREFVP